MSTINSKNVQVGTSGTANQNFTLYQPASPDGTVRLGVGNTGATTADVITATNAGNVGIGTSSPGQKLTVAGTIESTSGGVKFPDGTTQATAASLAFPAGTKMLFVQTAAPTGWTKDTTNNNNSAIRIVTGTAATGGTADFTTAFASQTPSGSVSTSISTVSGSVGVSLSSGGSVSGFTLTTNEIPSHTHGLRQGFPYSGGGGNQPTTEQGSQFSTATSFATGGGGSHSHGFSNPSYSGSFTFSSGTAASSFSGTAINLAVKYVDVIVATKD